MGNESFEKYVSNLKSEDRSIAKPIKNKRKLKTIRKYTTLSGPWAKSEKEKDELFV
jgi:hypothetical protein